MNTRFGVAGLIWALAITIPLSAQQIPENATRVSSGKGWVCQTHHLERGNQCIHVREATNTEIRELLVRRSIAAYAGSCPCPFNVDRAGRRCGRRSAYSRPGGASPLCYAGDVSDGLVQKLRDSAPRGGAHSRPRR